MRNLVLILVFPCSRVPGSPFRTIATISYGLQGCIVFCTQKTTFLGYGKPPRMPLLVAKTTRECHFGKIDKKQTFLDRRRPQKEGLQQPRKQSSQARLSSRFTKANICAAEPCGTIFPRQRKRKRRQSLKRKLGRHQTTLLLKTCHSHPSLDAGLAPKVCRKRF